MKFLSIKKFHFFSAFYTIPGDTKKICNSDQDCQKYNEKCHPLAYGHHWIWTMLGFPGVCGPKYCQKVAYHCQPIGQLFYGQLNPKTCQNGLCVYLSHFEYWNIYLCLPKCVQIKYVSENLQKSLKYWKNYQTSYMSTFRNGENDSQKGQSQLWDQMICQTKTAKKFLWNWLFILMSCNSLTNFEYEEAFAKPELLKFGKKTSLP